MNQLKFISSNIFVREIVFSLFGLTIVTPFHCFEKKKKRSASVR